MPGGNGSKPSSVKLPYTTANPVEEGWEKNSWYRAYNAANSRIRAQEDQHAAVAARASGRTREEAKALKSLYDNAPSKSRSSLPPPALVINH
jgi:hypothetical protein